MSSSIQTDHSQPRSISESSKLPEITTVEKVQAICEIVMKAASIKNRDLMHAAVESFDGIGLSNCSDKSEVQEPIKALIVNHEFWQQLKHANQSKRNNSVIDLRM